LLVLNVDVDHLATIKRGK